MSSYKRTPASKYTVQTLNITSRKRKERMIATSNCSNDCFFAFLQCNGRGRREQIELSFSFSPLTDWVKGGIEGRFCRDPLPDFFFFFFFLQEAPLSISGMGKDVHSLILSIQHFLFQPQRRLPSRASWRMVLERLSWRVTCSNYASFRLLTVVRRGSCGFKRVHRGFLCAHKADMYDHLLRRYRSVQNLGTSKLHC